jgi:hypothetical protein
MCFWRAESWSWQHTCAATLTGLYTGIWQPHSIADLEMGSPAVAAAAALSCLPAGKYTTDQLLSMSAEAAKRAAAASRRGAFGTAASSRSFSVIDTCFGYGGSSTGAAPGPGCYDVRAGLSEKAATAAARPSPVSLHIIAAAAAA